MFDEAVKINTKQPRISCPLCRADVFIKSKITFKEIVNY
jgi:DNA-directed RNA polymerase subunit RPC12/RpoP